MAGTREPLTIVHVTTFYPPYHFGGDGVQVQRLAEAQARRGHDVHVAHTPGAHILLRGQRSSTNGKDATRTPPAVPTVHAFDGLGGLVEPLLVQQTGRPVLSRRWFQRLLSRPAGRPPDVIHYHNVSLSGGVGVLSIGDAVKLYTPHEYWLACPTHLLFRYNREICQRRTCVRCTLHDARPPQLWRYTRLRDRNLAHVDRMVYPSEVTRRVYRAQGVDRPGPVLHHFLPERYLREAMSRGPRRPETPPYFLYVGRLAAVKGIESLLEHFADAPVPAPLRVVGRGPLESRLKARFADCPMVRFEGSADGETLGELYRDALALILPSAGYEVFGLVVVEAFAHGTPAIVSRVGGSLELIRESGAGAGFGDPAELQRALEKLGPGSGVRDEMGARGRDFARRELDESRYLDRYEALVREVGGA